jgi:hypothetical protein
MPMDARRRPLQASAGRLLALPPHTLDAFECLCGTVEFGGNLAIELGPKEQK